MPSSLSSNRFNNSSKLIGLKSMTSTETLKCNLSEYNSSGYSISFVSGFILCNGLLWICPCTFTYPSGISVSFNGL